MVVNLGTRDQIGALRDTHRTGSHFAQLPEAPASPGNNNADPCQNREGGHHHFLTASAPGPDQNHLLAAFPDAEFERLAPHLKLVAMPMGSVLHESGARLQHLYFPTTSIVSLHYVLENGGSAEFACVGNEGVVGITQFIGGDSTPSRAVVRSGGNGYRLAAPKLMEEFNRTGAAMHLLLLYAQALITQMSQSAVCNRHHSIEQQLCRWLLHTLDRLSSSELCVTQEMIAGMLGVRREGVTEAAGKLQAHGYIYTRRGHITVLDRDGLESHACECYGVVRKEFARLLPDVPPHHAWDL